MGWQPRKIYYIATIITSILFTYTLFTNNINILKHKPGILKSFNHNLWHKKRNSHESIYYDTIHILMGKQLLHTMIFFHQHF